MKAISLIQPYASLMAWRWKRNETRSWKTTHRGELAIHASARFPLFYRLLCKTPAFKQFIKSPDDLPTGAILSLGNLANVVTAREALALYLAMEGTLDEIAFGDYRIGRYAWQFDAMSVLKRPVPCTGSLGVWTVPKQIEVLVWNNSSHPTASAETSEQIYTRSPALARGAATFGL